MQSAPRPYDRPPTRSAAAGAASAANVPLPGANRGKRHPRLKALLHCAGLLAMLLSQAACSLRLPAPVELTSDDWGAYQVQQPAGTVTRLSFVFGRAGDAELDATVRALAARGALVARIDVDRFAANVLDRHERCLDLAGIVNWHADYLGRRFDLTDMAPPLLVGHGAGSELIYDLLAQAPALTFAAGVSDAPAQHLALRKPLCGGVPGAALAGKPGKRALRPRLLGAPWRVVGGMQNDALLRSVSAKNPNGQILMLPAGPLARAATDALDALDAAARPHAASLGDLPLVELPVKQATDSLVVIYSGDGGWRDIDKTLGDMLARQGMAVVGVDSVRYFWHRRDPQRIADDLARILDHYRSAWGSRRVVLIGYSFGADILPFAYNRLPSDWQQRVGTLALLAPGRGADFEVSISGWLGRASSAAAPILPELQRIAPDKVLCVYGAREKAESLCTAPGAGAITRLERPGDHHFDRRYDLIADAIRAHFAAGKS